jgi:hypothetical protein
MACEKEVLVRVRVTAAALCAAIFLGVGTARAETLVARAERLAVEAGAQAASGPTTKREPVVALVLSLVFPGLGQLYNGPTEQTKGIVMLAVAGATLGLWVAGANSDDCEIDEDFEVECGNDALMAIGALGYLGNYVWSAVDAPLRARAINRERGFALDVKPATIAGRPTVRAAATYRVPF